MHLIVPLKLVRFQTKEVLDFGKDLKIYPINEDLRSKLIKALPSDNFMNIIKSTLDNNMLYNYLDIPIVNNEKEIAVRKAYAFLKILRICQNNLSSINLIFIDDDSCKYNLLIVEIHTHNNYSIIDFYSTDIEVLKSLWSNYDNLISANNYNNRIYWAIFLHELANENRQPEMQIVNDTIALECLFSSSSQEITFQISNRASWFMCPEIAANNNITRRRYYNTIKKYYDIRSRIVHGNLDDFDATLRKLGDRSKYVEGNLNAHVRTILRKILKDKNLIDIFLKSQKELSEYLLSLTLKSDNINSGHI